MQKEISPWSVHNRHRHLWCLKENEINKHSEIWNQKHQRKLCVPETHQEESVVQFGSHLGSEPSSQFGTHLCFWSVQQLKKQRYMRCGKGGECKDGDGKIGDMGKRVRREVRGRDWTYLGPAPAPGSARKQWTPPPQPHCAGARRSLPPSRSPPSAAARRATPSSRRRRREEWDERE
jgi:hypothetical protein